MFLLGVSRDSAANVPLIPGLSPPGATSATAARKSRRTDRHTQSASEHARGAEAQAGRRPSEYYVEQEGIAQELRYALQLMRKHRWRCIDVSYMAVEEVAVQVMQMIGAVTASGTLPLGELRAFRAPWRPNFLRSFIRESRVNAPASRSVAESSMP